MPKDHGLPIAIHHTQQRLFQPEKLTVPRGFYLPRFSDSDAKTKTNTNTELGKNIVGNHRHAATAFTKPALAAKPLIVEIGAGKGKHAYHYAHQNPHQHVIAIERTANKFAAFAKLLHQAQAANRLNNLIAVHADAIAYCVFALPAHSVDTVFILYPNPEPKNVNQQWLNMPFFEFLLSRIKPQGSIVLATNIKAYSDNAYAKAVEVWRLPSRLYLVPSTSARTHFEIKYLQRGEVCWELEMIKPAVYPTHFDTWQPPVTCNGYRP